MDLNTEGTEVSKTKKFLKHFHCKVNSITLAFVLIPMIMLAFGSNTLANKVINGVTTQVTLSFDGKVISFETDSFDLESAILEEGIFLGDKDAVIPEKDTKLSGGDMTAKIKRATPIVIEDEGISSFVVSGYEDPKTILEQNGVKVYEEDKVSMDLIFDFYSENALGKKILIKRAPVVYVIVDNGKKEFRTWNTIVMGVLDEKRVLIGDNDKVEPARNHYVFNGMTITIIRVAESEVKEREVIAYSEEVIEDITLEYGRSYVKQSGSNGEKEHTYRIISEDGAMVSKTLINTKVTSEPVNKITMKGTKPFNAGNHWNTIVAASNLHGVSASKMHRVMMCESGGNAYAGSYYKGLFQYAPGTWAGASAQYPGGVYAGASIYDPIAQIYVTAWKAGRQGWGAWGCQ